MQEKVKPNIRYTKHIVSCTKTNIYNLCYSVSNKIITTIADEQISSAKFYPNIVL